MTLFDFLSAPPAAEALRDAATGESWSYERLSEESDALAGALRSGQRALVFCFCRLDARSVVAYLAAVRAGHAVALLDAELPAPLQARLLERFKPGFVLRPGEPELVVRPACAARADVEIHPDLRLLLSTSGTTGSPKFVRLSERNLDANAASIATYLALDAGERPMATLPIHYSYGLSVLHSHLLVGATIVFSAHSVMRPEFWDDFAQHECTSFAGVPYAYAMLERTGFRERELPTLRTMTQAGGRMAPEMIVRYHEHLAARDGRLVVMYGQTEATARIAYVPPARLPEKAGSIGIAIPAGRLAVLDDQGRSVPPGTVGELVYEGPNVMLGYAQAPADLARGDELAGRLMTGDLGYADDEGFHYVTGRSKRIAKVFGLRVNLDEVEAALSAGGPVAAVERRDCIVVFTVGAGGERDSLRLSLARTFNLNPRAFAIRSLDALPQLESGKVDYRALEDAADHPE